MLGSHADHQVAVQTRNSDCSETIHQQRANFHAKSDALEIIVSVVQITTRDRIYLGKKIWKAAVSLRSSLGHTGGGWGSYFSGFVLSRLRQSLEEISLSLFASEWWTSISTE